MDRSNRQKISKDVAKLNITINQLDKINLYRLLYPTREYAFFSSSHGTFTKINHILGHKKTTFTNLREQKSHNVCSQSTKELNQKLITKIAGKFQNTWGLNNTLPYNTQVKE